MPISLRVSAPDAVHDTHLTIGEKQGHQRSGAKSN
jgi:hypothetical protein